MNIGPMNLIESLGKSKIWNAVMGPAGIFMGSKVRTILSNPAYQLEGANLLPEQTILEVGCGTGFFTIPAAGMVGDDGCIIAMDILSGFLEQVKQKADQANVTNIQVIEANALHTGLTDKSIDKAILFGAVPFPSLPLHKLLPEMHRVLKNDGTMAIWLFPFDCGVPKKVIQSDLFSFLNKTNGVYNYQKLP